MYTISESQIQKLTCPAETAAAANSQQPVCCFFNKYVTIKNPQMSYIAQVIGVSNNNSSIFLDSIKSQVRITVLKETDDFAIELYTAVKSDNLDRIKELLRENRNLNEIGYSNMHILEIVFLHGNEEVIELFLKAGSDINTVYRYNCSAEANGENNPTTLFLSALAQSRMTVVNLLIKYGVNVDQPNSAGLTPLAFYSKVGRISMIEFLLANGANIELRDITGKTALTWSVYHGRVEAVKILLARGADIHTQDLFGKTPLFYASLHIKARSSTLNYFEKVFVYQLLVEKGARSPFIWYNKDTNKLNNENLIHKINSHNTHHRDYIEGYIYPLIARAINSLSLPLPPSLEALASGAIIKHISEITSQESNGNQDGHGNIHAVDEAIDQLEIPSSLKLQLKYI